ncbi:hypothetical protein P4H71_06870 [Paenibacillus kribbensis]|uniref:hypothetical protein n=1 Tax=Paenibacillus kribbensis TaxID=172713 RepID=UPI002DB87C87|nr:hypothetical protein [Paenibacillus kribbensis]MEC0234052.1 hypothetical protein [Paenibacillus kribbensis]
MKDINEVLSKLAAARVGCPNFVLDELERLYNEAEENGMATALLEADLLATKKELAERDRTIAQLQDMDRLHTSGAKQLVQDLHTLRVNRDKLQEALEQAQYHLREGYIISAESIVDEALGRE